jgi:hypothetical protein
LILLSGYLNSIQSEGLTFWRQNFKIITVKEVMKLLKPAPCLQQIFAKLKIDSYLIPQFFRKHSVQILKGFLNPDLVITF